MPSSKDRLTRSRRCSRHRLDLLLDTVNDVLLTSKASKRLGVSSGVKWCQVLWRSVNCCQGVSRMLFTLRALLFVQLLVIAARMKILRGYVPPMHWSTAQWPIFQNFPAAQGLESGITIFILTLMSVTVQSMQWIGCRGIKEHQPPASATPRTEFMAETPSSHPPRGLWWFGMARGVAAAKQPPAHEDVGDRGQKREPIQDATLPNLNMSTELRTSDGMSSKAISTNILGFQGWESWMKPTKSSSFVGRQQKMKNNPGLFAKVTPEKLTSEWSSVIKRKVLINFHKWRRTTMIKPKMQAIAKKGVPTAPILQSLRRRRTCG